MLQVRVLEHGTISRENNKGDSEETTREEGNKTGRFIHLKTEEQMCLNNNGY